MLNIQRQLVRRLRDLRVGIDMPDANTVYLRHLPANPNFFSKAMTNVLIKRSAHGLPFVTCVDADLRYTGQDPRIGQVFGAQPSGQGWRPLLLRPAIDRDPQVAIDHVLGALGSDGREPTVPADTEEQAGTLLGAFARPLARDQTLPACIGRDEQLDLAMSCLRRAQPARLVLIAGEAGVGKTLFLCTLANRLTPPPLLLDVHSLMQTSPYEHERFGLLRDVLDEAARRNATVAVEQIDYLLAALDPAIVLLSRFLDGGGRVIGTTLHPGAAVFGREPLRRRLAWIALEELPAMELLPIIEAAARSLADQHHVEIDPTCVRACLRAAESLDGALPGKAIALLDAATALAGVRGNRVLGPDDLMSLRDSGVWSHHARGEFEP